MHVLKVQSAFMYLPKKIYGHEKYVFCFPCNHHDSSVVHKYSCYFVLIYPVFMPCCQVNIGYHNIHYIILGESGNIKEISHKILHAYIRGAFGQLGIWSTG